MQLLEQFSLDSLHVENLKEVLSKAVFDSYLEHLEERIRSQGGQPVFLQDIFSSYISKNGDGIIRSWLWDVPGFRRWRVTRLDAGKKLQVLNSVAYPDYSNDQPLMGIDLLWFGASNKLVAVLDFQPLIQDKRYLHKHFQGLKFLRKKYAQLCNQEGMRSFDPEKYFSPWLLFCRGGLDHAKLYLPKAFDSFVNTYLELQKECKDGNPILSISEVKRLHNDYDLYCLEKDPAHGLFCSYFGKEWTDRFLKEFLFPGNST